MAVIKKIEIFKGIHAHIKYDMETDTDPKMIEKSFQDFISDGGRKTLPKAPDKITRKTKNA